MLIKVLRPLPYSRDGVAVETLPVGWEGEVRDDLAAGLLAAGFISAAQAGPEVAPAVKPQKPRKG